jgi:membrane protein YdbS with pleckstrin-like domain
MNTHSFDAHTVKMSQDFTDAPAVRTIALIGVVLVNVGAAYLIVSAIHNPTAFTVAAVIGTLAVVLIDIAAVREAIRRRRARNSR